MYLGNLAPLFLLSILTAASPEPLRNVPRTLHERQTPTADVVGGPTIPARCGTTGCKESSGLDCKVRTHFLYVCFAH